MRVRLTVVLALLTSMCTGQTLREARYRELLANELVRVYGLELAPRHTASLYQNTHDVFWIALDDSALTVVGEDGNSSALDLRTGDVRLLPSFAGKILRNDSGSALHGVLVELMSRGLTTGGCGCLTPVENAICGCKPAAHLPELWAFGLAKVTLAGTTLAAGQSFTSIVHRDDMLLVALTPVHLRDEAVPGATFDLASGEAVWVKAGNHQFRNTAEATARFVSVEF
jgi:hypothetical protein